MKYNNIVEGTFIKRPNRFIAHVLIDGKEEIAHVKNTGRCKELLVPGAVIYLEPATNPDRKTKFSLVSVIKGDRIINMDSQSPNYILHEALLAEKVAELPLLSKIKREFTYGKSRLDFYLEYEKTKVLIEVKGVTLEKNNIAYFPDAPTQRGIKHINELIQAVKNGYKCISFYVIQMGGIKEFSPNYITHPEYGAALKEARRLGVEVLAYDCSVSPSEVVLNKPIKIVL